MQKALFGLAWLIGAMMAAAPALAATPRHVALASGPAADLNGRCDRWRKPGSLADYAHAVDLAFNRNAEGRPRLPALDQAAYLIKRQRWLDAFSAIHGFDDPSWVRPGQGQEPLPAIVGQLTTVLKDCRIDLGPDYSLHSDFRFAWHTTRSEGQTRRLTLQF